MNCPCCGSAKHAIYSQPRGTNLVQYQVHQCSLCLSQFLNPKPSAQELASAYADNYYGESDSKFHPIIEKQLGRLRGIVTGRLAARLPSNSSILDIGCGNGLFLHELGKKGTFKLVGIEPPGKSAERAKAHTDIHLIESAFDSDQLESNRFDLVNMMHVYEHLDLPLKVLESCHRSLKRNGLLCIEIPNTAGWQSRLFRSHWFHLDPPRHLHLMHPKLLEQKLIQLGFEPIYTSSFSLQFGIFGWQQSTLNALGFKRDAAFEFFKGQAIYKGVLGKLSRIGLVGFLALTFPISLLLEGLSASFGRGSIIRLELRKK